MNYLVQVDNLNYNSQLINHYSSLKTVVINKLQS